MAISPLSQLFNTLLFGCYSLLTYSFTAILFQGVLVLISLLFFRKSIRRVRARAFLPILPVILFVFVVNCFRGNGEVLLRLGVFVLVRQGIQRGLYYVLVIVILFIMSRLLTQGFTQEELVGSLYSLGRFFGRLKLPGTLSGTADPLTHSPGGSVTGLTFFIILFSVLRMFQVAYAEIKLFFKKEDRSLRQRVIDYFHAVYGKSMDELDGIETISWETVRLLPLDYLYISLQVALLAASSLLRKPGVWW